MHARCMLQRTALAAFLWLAPGALPAAAQVEALFDLSAVATGPFPTNVFTRGDGTNLTNRRVALPKPDCGMRPSDCADIDTLNTLDGFNLQPRVQIPFSGDIDVASVGSRTLFFVNLGDTASPTEVRGLGSVTGVNQVVFDAATNVLTAESDALLRQHTRYLLVATDGILDSGGRPVTGSALARFLADGSPQRDRTLDSYRTQLRLALRAANLDPARVVSASVFTTQSNTAILEKIRTQIQSVVPAAARFDMGTTGAQRAVFSLDEIDPVAGITFQRQVGTAPRFASSQLPLAALRVIPGAVGQIAFGTYASATFLTSDRVVPAVGTRTGRPQIQGFNVVSFTLIVPAGPKPAAGWPVAVFGHGFGGEKNGSLTNAASLAAMGIATASINVVGHGGGPLGTLTVHRTGATPVTAPSGGRGMDLNGDGNIDATEGFGAGGLIVSRDTLRQTVADILQLNWMLRTGGVDVDGDARGDFDPSRVFYTGISLGGIYGTILLGVDPGVRAGVPNVPGGVLTEISRLSPAFRGMLAAAFGARTPSLLNALPLAPPLFGFNENIPLRNLPPLVNQVPGALAAAEAIDNLEWVQLSGDPLGYARHIRAEPLAGNQPKPLIFQFARGDMTVSNPTSTALVRAGEFQDRVTFFRNDLFLQGLLAGGAPAATVNALRNPHGFLGSIAGARTQTALAAQRQIATFFASNGATTIDPDGDGPLFETPIVALPEDLGIFPLQPTGAPAPADPADPSDP